MYFSNCIEKMHRACEDQTCTTHIESYYNPLHQSILTLNANKLIFKFTVLGR